MTTFNHRLLPRWRTIAVVTCFAIASITMSPPSNAEPVLLEDFRDTPELRWEYIGDNVMGGVSEGRVEFVSEDGEHALKLSGTVSTENRGGFIQARLPLTTELPETAQGIWLKVRGNDQRYFVHARTAGTLLPWQYYQAGFDVTENWQVIQLPWSAFETSGGLSGSVLRNTPLPEKIKSLAIVAFGRDHEADVEVAEIGYY
jgi:hypothetical protein